MARAEGFDAAQLAQLQRQYEDHPTPQRRKVLAFGFAWHDLPEEAQRLGLVDHVGDFHELPTAVQRWILRALPQSVDLYVTVDDEYTLPDSIDASIEAIPPGKRWRPDQPPSPQTASFPDRSAERTANCLCLRLMR